MQRARVAGFILVVGSVLSACSTGSGTPGGANASSTTAPANSTTTRAPGTISAKTLLATALRDGRAEKSLHYVSTSTVGTEHVTITGDVNRRDGTQTIVVTSGRQSGQVRIDLLSDVAYMDGDYFALHQFIGMTAAEARAAAGRWISVVPSDASFQSTAAALTVASVLSEIGVGSPRRLAGSTSISGVLTGPSSAGPGGAATLTLSAGVDPLPVRYAGTGTSGHKRFTEALTLSDWGETVAVRAPAASTPLDTILGGATPGTQQPTTV